MPCYIWKEPCRFDSFYHESYKFFILCNKVFNMLGTLCSVQRNTLFQASEHFVSSLLNTLFLWYKTKCSVL